MKKVLASDLAAAYHDPLIGPISKPAAREEDQDLVREIAAKVMAMPEREELIAELRARIEAGEYNPSGADIAEAMIRRAIADRIR
ncbi:MAG: flagellar biosynthesis anti-sigma factor FlgM [Fimbriimonadales bacterium]|nr:flagellar biosynthesis anti-sigma factor FlgM [Fimbriimonadales bacterium]